MKTNPESEIEWDYSAMESSAPSKRDRRIQILVILLFVGMLVFGIAKVVLKARATEKAWEEMETRLVAAALEVGEILPPDYHERIEDADSISPEEYEKFRDLLNAYAWENGVEIYACMMVGREIFTTASSFTEQEMADGDDTGFFYRHDMTHPGIWNAFDGKVGIPITDSYEFPGTDRIQIVYIPFETTSGKVYVLGAEATLP